MFKTGTNIRPANIVTGMVLGVSLILSACSTGMDSGGSSGNGGGTGGGDNTPQEPTFSNVQVILSNNCGGSGCHIGASESGVRLDGYDNVINSEGVQYGMLIVQPGSASGSPLIDKLESGPDFGQQMPLNGSPLSSEKVNLIKQWINDGAPNN